MIRISRYYVITVVCLIAVVFAVSSYGQSTITYVDAQAGSSGNTYATGGALKETSWVDLTSNAADLNDNHWVKRFGGEGWKAHNNGDVLQAMVSHLGKMPEITTEVVGVDNGIYEVWVFFWEQVFLDTQNWVMDAGLASGDLKIYSSPLGPVAASDSTSPVNAASLKFSNSVSVVGQGRKQKMFGVNLGQVKVTDGRIKVYVDKLFGIASGNRTIYDGVGYRLVTRNLTGAGVTNSTAGLQVVDPVVLKKWQKNGGGDWIGGDRSNDANSFYESPNWKAPASARSEGKGFDLHLSGATSQAQVSTPLQLPNSSSLIINDGASLDLNGNALNYSGKAALIVDSAYLQELGGMVPIDKNATLDLMVTNNAVINGAAADAICDFAGGSLLVTDSSCSFSSLVRGKVKISGYGSIEVSANSKQVIEGTTIELASPRARFRFIGKSMEKVINEDLDKFSVNGALPIYGSNPETVEDGDNILIRNDGGTGTALTVVK